jgi:hypothetical protein
MVSLSWTEEVEMRTATDNTGGAVVRDIREAVEQLRYDRRWAKRTGQVIRRMYAAAWGLAWYEAYPDGRVVTVGGV